MRKLSIILRTCDRVAAFSGGRPRDFGSKFDVMTKCLMSLKKSIDYFKSKGNEVSFTVVDDHSSDKMVEFIEILFPNSILKLKETGNGVSFGKCVDIAKNLDGLVLLIEDDYLLKEECILSMVESYYKIKSDLQTELCMHPTDYPDRYKTFYPSLLVLGSDRHFRTIRHTTCTFMYDASIFKEFEKELKVFCDYGVKLGVCEDNSVNLVYKKYPCFSPIPSLAEHYQYFDTLSPFFEVTS
ncbi:MAG: hypothetical protein RLZ10_2570 [Bacteroidota bacterium]|jgi:hypothetical protein